MIGTFVLAVFGLCGAVYSVYPDKPAVPRRFPHGGLVDALGGPGALPALSDSDE
jgi:NADH dehydrogenase (ubiquinone) 1 beta subcomplex subunit 8